MSSLPVDTHHEKFDILLRKLRLSMLELDEAREFLPLIGKELQHAKDSNNHEYEKILNGLSVVVKMYLAGKINLNESSVEVFDRLNFSKVPNPSRQTRRI